MIRRSFDIVVSLVLLIITVPLWVFIIIAILLESGRGPFYKSVRIGKDGKSFRMIKFRSMCYNSMQILDQRQLKDMKEKFKLKEDPRVTFVGKWLRKFSLDEIPQLLNVIKGEMSIVGPRPKLPEEIELYGDTKEELLSILPGITGYWQVYRKSANSDVFMREMDLYYVKKRNFSLDFKILIRTIIVIAKNTNY